MSGITQTNMAAKDEVKAVVVMPTFDNAATLGEVIDSASRLGVSIIVVNDGSTDATAAVLQARSALQTGGGLTICHHDRNRGKAAALRTGFDAARAGGFTHAITIDTDGQHSADDLPALLKAAARQPQALVIGTRDEATAGYPSRSRLGRRVSNALVRLESGVTVRDSQCGLRVYPLDLVMRADCQSGHFGFETEIITRAGWAGVPVIGVGVSCKYLAPDQRVSHFKPWRDSLRAVAMHARLMLQMMTAWQATAWGRMRSVEPAPRVPPVETLT